MKRMKIEYLATTDLIPYENNPRLNDGAVDAVAASIKEFGFQVPIVIDKRNVIVAGHTRLKAAEKLGLSEVPCIRADELTDEQVKAFRLADNKVGEFALWDMEKLNVELSELAEFDIDMSQFGFDLDVNPVEIEEDDFDEESAASAPPRVKRGEVWQLGDHRLMCGDSSSSEDFQILVAGGALAAMVFTDTPYGVAIGDKNKALDAVQKSGWITENIENDAIGEEELYELLKSAFENVQKYCEEDAVYFVTSPQGGSLGLMMMMMRDAGLPVRHVLMWKKNCPTFSIGRLDYDYQHEPIFYTWKNKHHNYRKGEKRSTVWDYDKPRACNLHPTMKPVELVANAILDGSREGDTVLDAFGGSGTTLIACEQLGRKCLMMELDPHYCDVIIKRWEDLTGGKAVLVNE